MVEELGIFFIRAVYFSLGLESVVFSRNSVDEFRKEALVSAAARSAEGTRSRLRSGREVETI